MIDEESVLRNLKALRDVTGAVVWRTGRAPVGLLPEPLNSSATGLLSAGVGSIEEVVAMAGLGKIEDLCFRTKMTQCLALRCDDWQAIVLSPRDADAGRLRNAISELLRQTV